MDFVPNHTSAQHPYYLSAAQRGPASPYYDFYDRDAAGEVTTYFDWENLKNLKYDNPEVQRYMIEAFAYWVREFGIDGFRVDAAWGVRERAPEFWPRWRDELKRIDPDLLLIAEASARDPYYVIVGFDAAYDWTDKLGEWAWHDAFEEGAPTAARLRAALIGSRSVEAERHARSGALVLRFLNNNDTGERSSRVTGSAHPPGCDHAADLAGPAADLYRRRSRRRVRAVREGPDAELDGCSRSVRALRPARWFSGASTAVLRSERLECSRRHIPTPCSPICGRASGAKTTSSSS